MNKRTPMSLLASFEKSQARRRKRNAILGTVQVLILLVTIAGAFIVRKHNQVTYEKSKTKITNLVGDHTYIGSTNNSIFTGTPGDVTFELKLEDGTFKTCRCLDGVFQPLVCRPY